MIIPFFGPYGMHWALAHVFPIIIHCNMISISVILEVLSSPTNFSCNRLTFERTLFKTKMALKVYYQIYEYQVVKTRSGDTAPHHLGSSHIVIYEGTKEMQFFLLHIFHFMVCLTLHCLKDTVQKTKSR